MSQVSKMQRAYDLQKPPAVQRLPRLEKSQLLQQNKNNFTMKGNMIVLEPKSVAVKSVKHTQPTALPPVSKVPRKTQRDTSCTGQTVLPPIFKGSQKTQPGFSLHQQTVLPQIHKNGQKPSHQRAVQQEDSMLRRKTFSVETSDSKKRPKVVEAPTVKRAAMSPESVLRDSKLHLTEYELAEIKNYKQVWYLGKTTNRTRTSTVSETQDTESFNCGYDTKEGFYKAAINDHLAYRFEILEALGAGYSGQVLKCMDHKTKKLVAVKVIRSKDSIHQLGKAELKILETLRELDKSNKANIVHMKESFYFRNHLCITFDLFQKDLFKALEETNKHGFSEEELSKYTTDVLKCLQMLKKETIIHGDIKPDNVLLYKKDGETRAALSDFGGSYFAKDRDRPPIQTLFYMAPEMLLGKTCNLAVDMWSLGCMLAELYLGRCLFDGNDIIDQFSCIMKILGIPPAELLEEAPKRNYYFDSEGIPLSVTDIIRDSTTLFTEMKSENPYFLNFISRCLEYDPTKRMTPEEALQHPWILQNEKTKPATGARKSRPHVSGPSSKKKPVLLKREKIPPPLLEPIKKTKAKKCRCSEEH